MVKLLGYWCFEKKNLLYLKINPILFGSLDFYLYICLNNIKTYNMENTTTYHFEVKIRKASGMIPKDSDGNNIPSINLTKTFNPLFLETVMIRLFKDFEAITPEGSDINISALLPNEIGGTFMNMASYYGSEKRFVTQGVYENRTLEK